MTTEIKVSKIDYYTWKIGSLVLLLILIIYMYFTVNHNPYANPSGYIEAVINSSLYGMCLIRFPAECPINTIICESNIDKLKQEISKDDN